ncbi:MAG: phosphomannomutase/phosphoglucomutase [Bacteroidales bacterium]
MGAFKAYDIRGIYPEDFTKEEVYKIGYFLPELLNTRKVLVGRDVRLSSPEIFAYLCEGITDAGADVYNLGLATTPMVYWVTAKFAFDASVMITASHNPKEYNGLKISRTHALPVGLDTGLGELQRWLTERRVHVFKKKGNLIDFPQTEVYLAFQKKQLPEIANLNIAIDCSNGMAGLFVRDLLGYAPHYIFEDLDGTFPNHESNPLEAENIVDLQNLVRKVHADIGVIFDGDADRVMFTDENAKFISPDLMIALMAHHFLDADHQGATVLQDIRSSKAVTEYVESLGGKMKTWRVGRAYAAAKMREIDALYGGELAGHYYFKEFYYSDSGLMACSIILGIFSEFKKQGKKVSEVIAQIAKYANSGELNFRLTRKQEAMEAVKNFFLNEEKPSAFYDFDGYRMEYPHWWFNIRLSNTEPYLRLIVEANTPQLLEEKLEKIRTIIETYS